MAVEPPPERAGVPRKSSLSFRAALLCALALASALFTFRLGAKDLWDASEGRPPESAREMLQRHEFTVQYTDGAVDLTKPPVYAWLVCLSFTLTGHQTEAAARIPSVLAALGILCAAALLARSIAGRRAGILAAILCATQVRFLWQARLAELETLLALGVVFAYFALHKALSADSRSGRVRAFLGWGAAMGFAAAVKGPVAYLLVLPATVAILLANHRASLLRSREFWLALPLALLLGAAWPVAAILRDPAALDTLRSYAEGQNVGHLRDAFYYLWQYPLNAMPWTPLVCCGLALPLRSKPPFRDAVKLPFIGFAFPFVLLTCLHAKQTHYLIPIFPLGAVLAALWLDRAWDSRAARVALSLCAAAVCVMAAGIGFFRQILPADVREAIPSQAALLTGVFALLLAAAAPLLARRTMRTAVAALFGALFLVETFVVGYAAPAFNARNSSRPFLRRVAARVPEDAPLASSIFGSHSDHLFYLGRNVILLHDTEDLRSFLAKHATGYALVWHRQAKALGRDATVLLVDDAFQKKERKVALVAARASGGSR